MHQMGYLKTLSERLTVHVSRSMFSNNPFGALGVDTVYVGIGLTIYLSLCFLAADLEERISLI